MNDDRQPTVRDDHVLKVTKAVSAAIVPVLTAAFVILYLFPTRTRQLWSWTITPTMSAMLMGAGYLSGAYFFVRAATVRQWHRVGVGFLGVTVFATLLGVATVMHWDRFNHGHVSFWAWALLYFSTPVLIPWLWARNRRTDPGLPAPGDRLVPTWVRATMGTVGALQLVVAAVMFVRPTAAIGWSPWTLTPLTCRSLSAFVAFPAVTYLAFAFERRWSSFQIVVETAMIGMVLIGIAAVRAWDEFTVGGDGLIWGWRVGLVVAFALLAALRTAMSRPVGPQGPAPA
ncbi:MAG: hypothetical protein AB1673_13610 [Actinomycetota bacterium]